MAEEKKQRMGSTDSSNKPEAFHHDRAGSPSVSSPTTAVGDNSSDHRYAATKAENPLTGMSKEELKQLAEDYCSRYGFTSEDDLRVFRLGALIAGSDFRWDNVPGLTEAEVAGLELERDHKYKSLPKTLIGVVVVCVSGTPLFYPSPRPGLHYGIRKLTLLPM